MNRETLVANLNGIFATYGIPVGSDPLTATLFPSVIVSAGSPYRVRDQMCWTKTWELTIVAGRLDDVGVHDTMDGLADQMCDGLEGLAGLANRGASNAPGPLTIGDVDYLAVAFTVTDYGGLT